MLAMDVKTDSGIIYYDMPIIMNFYDFSSQHIGCDFIIVNENVTKDMGQVKIVACTEEERYNRKLKKVFREKYGKKDFSFVHNISEVAAYGFL